MSGPVMKENPERPCTVGATEAAVPKPTVLTEEEKAMLADLPRNYARMTANSIMGASRVIQAAEKSTQIGKTADWIEAMKELEAASENLRANDLSQAEDMLMHQAIGLQALHVRLTEMAFRVLASPHQFDVFMRYALRAQAQGRATIEALAEIKNPPVLFARQANITSGPQQINNGEPSLVRVRENGSEHNELLGEANELTVADRSTDRPTERHAEHDASTGIAAGSAEQSADRHAQDSTDNDADHDADHGAFSRALFLGLGPQVLFGCGQAAGSAIRNASSPVRLSSSAPQSICSPRHKATSPSRYGRL